MTDREENFYIGTFLTIVYLLIGLVVDAVISTAGGIPEADNFTRNDVAIMFLWPLFVIKYLLIGIWIVLSTGFGLLF